MKLSELLEYKDIVIQCHDHPDADTIASAYGLYLYYKNRGMSTRIIYAGKDKIQKRNLELMIKELDIPIEYITSLDYVPELLITVDCQYGEGNVTHFPAKKIAIIDHHHDCGHSADYKEIRTTFGSCATLIYMLLLEEKYPIQSDIKLMTALFYGLYMDTNEFSEIKHPYDMDMIEELKPNDVLMQALKNCNFTLRELEIAGIALMRCTISETMHFAIVRADECDPNLLGFISDLVLQVEGVNTCIVFCEFDYGFRLSIRNCNQETTAREIAVCLMKYIGTGGGHKDKAGGYVIRSLFEENYPNTNFVAYLLNSLKSYFTNYDVIDISTEDIHKEEMQLYERECSLYGVCKATDLAMIGASLKIRTINREIDVYVTENLYLLMNMKGEVFTVDKEVFDHNYELAQEHFECKPDYRPSVKIDNEPKSIRLTNYLKCCMSLNCQRILARKLEKTTKMYSSNKDNEYLLGEIGDYLAINVEDNNEVMIIKREQFNKYYRLL